MAIDTKSQLDYAKMDLLRFTTAGSVDDGKSTLIGRLLFDSKGVFEDQLEAIRRTTEKRGGEDIDLALITDGLSAEREQGITIDVAYRYFATANRKFIIADTPGHEQYTRNMVTGASTANLAIVLIDARNGVMTQSRRHGFIASLLGIPHVTVAINKMDLVNFSEETYEKIKKDYEAFAKQVGIKDIKVIPISALKGDNVVKPSENMKWYQGPTLLEYLEKVEISHDQNLKDFRFPVQTVLRPNLDYRGFAGRVASGIVKKGDKVKVLPSGFESTVKSIDTFDGELDQAFPPMSVTLRLTDEVDVSRGDMLVHPDNMPKSSNKITAELCWMVSESLSLKKKYSIKHTTQTIKAMVTEIEYRTNINSLEKEKVDQLNLNDIARVKIQTLKPLYYDAYAQNRNTGNFILIDELTNNTVAAGMIVE
ncbi:MAG TPA: sulfate adenylyltransferase subunit CysN [bacterium]|jgi:sulfate adenylyltransferase subunit 1|nr:sulfate adenylyltransferase subunit CysN [bacterium]